MCRHFSQAQTSEQYLAYQAEDDVHDIDLIVTRLFT